MKLSFRQGIVRHQKDTYGNQQFLLEQSEGIDLITENDPTTITFAHKDRNYVYVEKRSVPLAWTGPFAQDGTNYWLYWDLDLVTGVRTFGHTTLEPLVGPTAPLPAAIDQHWFDTATNTMKVFNGASYKERVRVFASKYVNGTVIQSHTGGNVFEGSQVGLIQSAEGGALIFDDADKPLRRGDGTFITTADKLASGLPNASNIKIEALQFTARASTNIAAYHLVYLNDFDSILPADPLKLHNVPFGIIEEDAYTGEPVAVTTDGVICNPNWNWSEAGAELYIDNAGMITDQLQAGMLPIGYVLSQSEILLKTSGVTQVTLEGEIGGVEQLSQLTDVELSDVSDGESLRYDIETGKWINVPYSIGPTTFENLDDTYIVEPTDFQVPQFQDGRWVNAHLPTPIRTFESLDDTYIVEPTDFQVPQFQDGRWVNADLPTPLLSLDDLTDVNVGDASYGMVLRYVPGIDGGPDEWVPTLSGGEFLYQLNDVSWDVQTATDGQLLMFRQGDGIEALSEWVAVDQSELNINTTVSGASDVTLGIVMEGQVLAFREGYWVNETIDSGASVINELNDVNIINPQMGDNLMYIPGIDATPGTWVNASSRPESLLHFNAAIGGGVTPILVGVEWNTIRCTQDTTLEFDFDGIYSDEAAEFTLEIYPGSHAITWPAGIIGDTTLDANKMNIFTFIKRPAVVGLSERIYCMKVNIANDNIDPRVPVAV